MANPAGTVSGAPKLRALEVIRELEPVKRNIYAGAISYIAWNGDADPAKEWEETMNKGRALFCAVARAAGGL